MNVGRNDPCPCGSGKKYKKCCLNKELSVADAGTERESPQKLTESEQFEALLTPILELSQSHNMVDAFGEAYERFFFEDLDDVETQYARMLFFPWVLFLKKLPGGSTVARRYLNRHRPELSPVAIRMLEQTGSERFRLVEIQEVRFHQGMRLKDLHSGEVFEVQERAATESLHQWDLIVVRLRRYSSHIQLDMAVPLARRYLDFVMDGLEVLLEEIGTGRLDERLFELMTEQFDVVHRLIVEANRLANRPPQLQTTDGEPMEFCEAYYEVDDVDKVRDVLSRHRSFDPSGQELVWLSGHRKKRAHQNLEQIVLGRVHFGDNKLTLVTNSRPRLKKGKALLEKNVGTHIRHKLDSFEDAQKIFDSVEQPTGTPPQEEDIPKDVMEELVSQHTRRYYLEQWPNAPVPALDGMTPREAAQDPSMLPRLVEQLKQFSLLMSRNPVGDFKVEELLSLLGVELD